MQKKEIPCRTSSWSSTQYPPSLSSLSSLSSSIELQQEISVKNTFVHFEEERKRDPRRCYERSATDPTHSLGTLPDSVAVIEDLPQEDLVKSISGSAERPEEAQRERTRPVLRHTTTPDLWEQLHIIEEDTAQAAAEEKPRKVAEETTKGKSKIEDDSSSQPVISRIVTPDQWEQSNMRMQQMQQVAQMRNSCGAPSSSDPALILAPVWEQEPLQQMQPLPPWEQEPLQQTQQQPSQPLQRIQQPLQQMQQQPLQPLQQPQQPLQTKQQPFQLLQPLQQQLLQQPLQTQQQPSQQHQSLHQPQLRQQLLQIPCMTATAAFPISPLTSPLASPLASPLTSPRTAATATTAATAAAPVLLLSNHGLVPASPSHGYASSELPHLLGRHVQQYPAQDSTYPVHGDKSCPLTKSPSSRIPDSPACPQGGVLTEELPDGRSLIRWSVDGRKLATNAEKIISSEFNLKLPGQEEAQPFRMMIHAKVTGGRHGAGFLKAAGRGSIYLKCQSCLEDAAPPVTLRIDVSGSGAGREQRGPFQHNFSERGCCGFEEDKDWNFKSMLSKSSKWFEVCLEVLPHQ